MMAHKVYCPECGHDDFEPDDEGHGDFKTEHAEWYEEQHCPACGCHFTYVLRYVPIDHSFKIWEHGEMNEGTGE